MAYKGVYYAPHNLTFEQARGQLVQDVDHWARTRAARDGYVWKTAISSYVQDEHQRYAHSDVAKIIADLKRERGWTEDRDGLLRPPREGAVERDRLTTKERNRLPDYAFALPERRALPLHDAAHVRNAAARLEQMRSFYRSVTPSEYRRARQAILRRQAELGIGPFNPRYASRYGVRAGKVAVSERRRPESRMRAAADRDPQAPTAVLLNVSRRPEGTNYTVRVPDPKNPRGYDIVDVLRHDNGAVSTRSASRSTRTPFHAQKFVQRYLAESRSEQEEMRVGRDHNKRRIV